MRLTLINVGQLLECWKYGKTAEVISKVTAAPSLTIPNNNLILLFEFSILSDLISKYEISLR